MRTRDLRRPRASYFTERGRRVEKSGVAEGLRDEMGLSRTGLLTRLLRDRRGVGNPSYGMSRSSRPPCFDGLHRRVGKPVPRISAPLQLVEPPQVHRAVVVGGGEEAAVGREGDGVDAVDVAVQDRELAARGDVPD